MPATQPFTPDQTVFTLSLIANLGSGLVGTVSEIEDALATEINNQLLAFKPELGSWRVVWGPAVFQSLTSVRAENAVYVATSDDQPGRYVAAIAGTNPYSAFDWVIEDAFVAGQSAWEFGTPPANLKPALSDGTDRGLTIVQQLRPGPNQPGNAATLLEFFQNLPAGAIQITTTGHSLGGALSPVVALWLQDIQPQWDPTSRATLSCLASAGPTPGNQDFANYYASRPVGSRTTRIHNALDVVPHAWNSGDLAEVDDLYAPDIQANALVRGFVFLAELLSRRGNYAQPFPDAPALAGQVNRDLINPRANSFDNFATQLSFQHVDAYVTLLGVDVLSPALAQVRQAALLPGSQGAIAALEQKLLRQLAMATLRGHVPPT